MLTLQMRTRAGFGSPWLGLKAMKLAGLLLLPAGWAIVLTAVSILASAGQQAGFVLAGVGVEIMGLILLARAHRVAPEETR
jgi:hypothetical protein